MRGAWRLALPLLAQLGTSSCAGGQAAPSPVPASFTRADTAGLRRTLDSLASAHHGIVGYAVHDVDTGEHLARRGDETFSTASLIKVSILVTVFRASSRSTIRSRC